MNSGEDDDATAKAFAAIEQKLQGFKGQGGKPGEGVFSIAHNSGVTDKSKKNGPYYQLNAVQWMEQELQENVYETKRAKDHQSLAKTPKRTPLMERAGTPIMSNSSSSRSLKGLAEGSRSNYSLVDNSEDTDEAMEEEPMPMQTPLRRKFKTSQVGDAWKNPSAGVSALKPSVFRRHHDALWEYLRTKRSLDNRMQLERQERELEQAENHMMIDTPMGVSSLSNEESKAEVEYCQTLCQIGYGLSSIEVDKHGSSMEEGHFWDLLATLRKLNLSALIWNDDSTSLTQNSSSEAFFLQQLTHRIEATSKELVEALSSNHGDSSLSLPLVLERRAKLLKWIQSCLALESKDTRSKLISTTTPSPCHPDDPSLPSLVSEMDRSILKTMMQACLSLVLEGKLAEARELARSRGQAWRAGAWMGGEAPGYESVLRDDTQTLEWKRVGNPERFLWKRQVWKVGRKILLQKTSQQTHASDVGNEEAAIYSILADDVENALENPCIRSSWTKSLCVLLMGAHGRTKDEVLHRHNLLLRRNGTVFPGSQYEAQENEQLMHSASLSAMTEAKMAARLENNPFLKQQRQNTQQRFSYQSAIMAFVVGKSAILDLCQRETSRMVSQLREVASKGDSRDDEYVLQDWEGVRFLTHLTLFLDSLQGSSTPIVCNGITEQKNAILYEYVQYLESRPDLWHMITLYVSFLPESKILDYFPTVLAQVLDNTERENMTRQIQELMPSLELPLLSRVVRRSLSCQGGEGMDELKCKSLYWLFQKKEHCGDALICANILLREFFMDEDDDKTHAALAFLKDHLPEDFLGEIELYFSVVKDTETSEGSPNANAIAKVSNAMVEHMAYRGYLEAYEIFEGWKDILNQTPTALLEENQFQIPNYSNLSEIEKGIADANAQRTWVKEKRKHLKIAVGVADQARSAWYNVLTHPGGWLSSEGDDKVLDENDFGEEQNRRRDMAKIRSRHLVLAASLYHQVCEETASWLSRSLHEAEHFGLTREEAVQRLQSNAENPGQTTPEYWYQQALDLAILVAGDEYGIHQAFSSCDLQDLMTKLGETAVSKLMVV